MHRRFLPAGPSAATLEYTARLWWGLAIVLWIFGLIAFGSVAVFAA